MDLAEFNIFNKKFVILLGGFVLFYLLSIGGFYWPILQSIIFYLLALTMIVLVAWRWQWAMILFLAEWFFGQSGHMFEFYGLSLGLVLFVVLMAGWLAHKIIKQEQIMFFGRSISVGWLLFVLFLFLAVLCGYWNHHSESLIVGDALSYSFLLLIFPLIEFLQVIKNRQWLIRIVAAAILGIGIFTILNLLAYSLHLSQVHDSYYWWIRNVLIGKVTDTGQGFFRIVLPAHLWFLPALLVVLAAWWQKEVSLKIKKQLLLLAIFLSLALLINFSRAYFLGLMVGLLLFKIFLPWRRWLLFLLVVVLVLIVEFNVIYFITTKHWSGFGFLSGRLGTIVQPEDEMSSLTRLRILPDLLTNIKNNLLTGVGLGATIAYQDPLSQTLKSTYYIDWGWLQLLVGVGLLGLVAYLIFLGQIITGLIKKIRARFNQTIYVGLLSGLLALMIATLTGPFLFHPLGIFYQLIIISLL